MKTLLVLSVGLAIGEIVGWIVGILRIPIGLSSSKVPIVWTRIRDQLFS